MIEARSQRVKIDAFDLDHTLLKKNSSFQFGIYLYRRNLISFLTMLSLCWYYLNFKWNRISIEALHQKTCDLFFKNKSISRLDEIVAQFVEENFDKLLYRPVYHLLENAKNQGHYTVLLSSSPDFIVRKFAQYFEVDEWAATTYDINQGRIDGVSALMEGLDKASYLRNLRDRLGVDKKDITAYSDDIRDLPFLLEAGSAVVVNPAAGLRKVCQNYNWTVM